MLFELFDTSSELFGISFEHSETLFELFGTSTSFEHSETLFEQFEQSSGMSKGEL